MTAIESISDQSAIDVEQLASKILSEFPKLEPDSRRVAIQLYRLLAKGNLVSHEDLAQVSETSMDRINEILEDWTGVYYEDEKIVGFWGLTPKPFSKHLFKVDGQINYTWCAWDSLFLPEILGKTAEVESTDPETNQTIRLTVAPEGIVNVEPESAVMSILEPQEGFREDVVANFCHFVHFFPTVEVGKKWIEKTPGISLMSIEDAFELGKIRNQRQFKEALQMATA